MPRPSRREYRVCPSILRTVETLLPIRRAPRLKVRNDNPCTGVAASDRDDDKELQWLYLDELMQLLAGEDVPVEARCIYALATYLYLLCGEPKGLSWEDVARGTISIRRSYNPKTRRIRQTTAPFNEVDQDSRHPA